MTDHAIVLGEAPEWVSVERFEPGETSHTTVTRLAACAALGGFLFGYDSAVINGAVTAIGNHFHASAGTLGLTVSSALLGAAAGAVVAAPVADRTGRKAAMWVAAVLFVISAIGATFADTLGLLAVFRVIVGVGVGVGVASVIAPAYIAEIAPARIRGRLGSVQQLAIVLGIFIALLVDYVLATAAGGEQHTFALGLDAWRWMFLAMTVPAVIYGLLAITIPESPRYLVSRGRFDEAEQVLRRVLGNVDVGAKVRQIRQTLSTEHRPRFADVRGPALGLMPIVWVGIGLSVFQQFVGINVIFYYSSVLWQAVGFSESSSLAITVITSVVNIATTLVAISLIDKTGRRPLLLIGSLGMTVTLGVMALIFGTTSLNSHGDPVLHGLAGPVALVAANLFVVFFGMSWGPVVWVMLGEKFPNRIRAAALAVAASAQWIANWVISTTFPSLKNAGLGLAYGIYAACALLSFLFVMRFISETKGKELEEMPEGIGGGVMRHQTAAVTFASVAPSGAPPCRFRARPAVHIRSPPQLRADLGPLPDMTAGPILAVCRTVEGGGHTCTKSGPPAAGDPRGLSESSGRCAQRSGVSGPSTRGPPFSCSVLRSLPRPAAPWRSSARH